MAKLSGFQYQAYVGAQRGTNRTAASGKAKWLSVPSPPGSPTWHQSDSCIGQSLTNTRRAKHKKGKMRENPKFHRHSLQINVLATEKHFVLQQKHAQAGGGFHQKHFVICEMCLLNN